MSIHLPTKFKRHPFLLGTLILSGTGVISRIIGFFYRIYLARSFGEEGMGIYQLIGPVLALTFSLCTGSYQTAISKYVAREATKEHSRSYAPLFSGLQVSLILSVLCSVLLYFFAPFIGTNLLSESRTIPLLRLLAWSIPFSSIHSCIDGYFYGLQKTSVPALAQLLEQFARVGCVFAVSTMFLRAGKTPPIGVAILGLTAGEIVSSIFTTSLLFRFLHSKNSTFLDHKNPNFMQHKNPALSQMKKSNPILPKNPAPLQDKNSDSVQSKNPTPPQGKTHTHKRDSFYLPILKMALPLTANHITLNLLQSVEATSIPSLLRLHGYDPTTSLSMYGVLTGMAMPLIFFPNALTGSVAILLLPRISKDQALGQSDKIKNTIQKTVSSCLLLGFGAMVFLGLWGKWLGSFLFHSALAGHYITTLAFICPFLYLNMTLGSILQGLGFAGKLFCFHMISLSLRLFFVFYMIPKIGIAGFFYGFLIGQLMQCALSLTCLIRSLRKNQNES